MEREFFNEDEWLRNGGQMEYGQGVSPVQYPVPMPPAPTSPTTSAPPPTTGGGGKTPQQIEAEGRAYDQANGLIGGYMMNGVWVNGSPMGGGPRGIGEGDPLTLTDSTILPNQNFQWPTYSPQTFNFAEFGGFKPFQAPSMDEILADPVLQAQLTEGQKRIKQDRAFAGVLNTGGTLKDLFDWQSDRIKLGANDAFDRKFKVYDVNERQNPFNTWSANKDKYFQELNTNLPSVQNEFLYNQYRPAEALWKQNYDIWAKQGDWLTSLSQPPE